MLRPRTVAVRDFQITMNSDDFEQRLQRQPLRPVPADWKRDILQAAQASARSVTPAEPWLTVAWRELFWSCRRIWFGLATVWGVILLLNVSQPAPAQLMAATPVNVSVDWLQAYQDQQRQIMAELGSIERPDAEPPKPRLPQPRSERLPVAVSV